jgi:CheY-like chemotaxis protein
MAEVKRILVVDDHFEMLEFLRSMLELSNRDYEVLAVPSGEEGLLELKRTRFDLLITDVRLPGMSGFDLVRQVRRLAYDLPVIMITAYSSPQGQREAADLNVLRYFRKPLDTDAILTAVHVALYGESTPVSNVKAPSGKQSGSHVAIESTSAVHRRLETLRADIGADGLLLVTQDGQIADKIGNLRGLNLETIAQAVASNMLHSFQLSDLLEQEPPLTVQYHAGDKTELYFVNVARQYAVVMLFDAQARRGRIGTIWVFAQRAIKELADMIYEETAVSPPPAVEPEPEPKPKEVPPFTKPEPADAPQQPEPLIQAPVDVVEELPIPPEVEAEIASIFAKVEPLTETSELENFWDEALSSGVDDENAGEGLSWEEAKKKGLIPSDLEEFDESGE